MVPLGTDPAPGRQGWEESIRVPGIVRFPRRIKGGRRGDTFFTHVDFAPTLLGFCGVKASAEMQGADLSAVLAEGKGAAPDSAFFQIFGPYAGDGTEAGWRGVRTRRHMYARYETGLWVLYDLERDPYEQKNLTGDTALVREMERLVSDWMARTGDSWKYDWKGPMEDGGRLYRHRTFYTVNEYLNWAAQAGVK
jgi:arylsulfatase A-like enzyme